MLRGYSREPGPRSAAFALDNVAIVVRCLDDDCDASAYAERARHAVERAPEGSPTAPSARAREGDVVLPSSLLAGRVVSRGPAVVSKTGARSFVVRRTGPGALEVEVVGVDHRLRPTR
jgi:hypothetical protein